MLKIYTLEKKMTYLVPKNAVIYNKIKMTHWGNLIQWLLNGTLITCLCTKTISSNFKIDIQILRLNLKYLFFNNIKVGRNELKKLHMLHEIVLLQMYICSKVRK